MAGGGVSLVTFPDSLHVYPNFLIALLSLFYSVAFLLCTCNYLYLESHTLTSFLCRSTHFPRIRPKIRSRGLATPTIIISCGVHEGGVYFTHGFCAALVRCQCLMESGVYSSILYFS